MTYTNWQRMHELAQYEQWMTETALPFWSDRGFDRGASRFVERLDSDGRPVDVPQRAMVQARQIYVFSHAHELRWHADGRELAERAMRSLLRDFCTETATDARFAFSIARSGIIVSDVADAYTHAFVMFALAWLYRVTHDARLLELAAKTNVFIKAHLADDVHGGLYDAWPVTSDDKRQNPVMHLLEAYLALERAAPGRGYLDDARGLVTLLTTRLLSAPDGVILEYFARDWSSHRDAARADVFEPGHHFEWVWLLGEWSALSGEPVEQIMAQLYESAMQHGRAESGLLFDEVDVAMKVRKCSTRLWPHTEAIKAAAAQHKRGVDGAARFAAANARALRERFLDAPFAGGWTDHFSAEGVPLVSHVPASSLYHLFFAAAESHAAFLGGSSAVDAHERRSSARVA